MSMTHWSIVLFALAAVAGLSMAVMHFRGQTPPKTALAVLHGIFAASGLVVLLLAALDIGLGGAGNLALALFVAAALGGFVLLSFHLRRRSLPNGLVVGHAVLAVAAFVILLSAVFLTAS